MSYEKELDFIVEMTSWDKIEKWNKHILTKEKSLKVSTGNLNTSYSNI